MTAVAPEEKPARRGPVFSKWKPKEWTPVYEQIVLMACNGKYSNKQIAEMFNMHEFHISRIINTPQAALIRRQVLDALQERIATTTIPERLERLALKAMDNITNVIDNPELRAKAPFAVYDRSLELLKISGKVEDQDKKDDDKTPTTIVFSDKAAALIAEGLALSDRGRALHSRLLAVKNSVEISERPAANG